MNFIVKNKPHTFTSFLTLRASKVTEMSSPENTWIGHFLAEPSSALYLRIPPDFLSDFLSDPSLTEQFPKIDAARQLLLSNVPGDDATDNTARNLYARAHASFLLTDAGADAIFSRAQGDSRLRCPRLFCKNCVCFPSPGPTETSNTSISMFCPTCRQFYKLEQSDGMNPDFFASPYIDPLISKHPESVTKDQPPEYVPRIYGFRLYTETEE